MTRFLMCPPIHYAVAREVTPWTRTERKVDSSLAEAQWQGLYDWLAAQKNTAVELLEPIKGLTDLVFTSQAGFVTQGRFIKSRFRQRARRNEEIEIERWFRKKNYEVKTVAEPYFFEGEGDFLRMGAELFAGYHLRSELESLENTAELMKSAHSPLEISDGRFYHLDSCFGPLDDKTAFIFQGAFEPYAYLSLLEMVPDPIRVPEEEALRLVCNSFSVGKQVVMPLGCPVTRKAAESRGFEVTELDFSEYLKSGGAAKSLVLNL